MKDIVKIGSELIENNRNKSTKSKDDFFKKRTSGKIKNYTHTQGKMSVKNG